MPLSSPTRSYRYVGPEAIKKSATRDVNFLRVKDAQAMWAWTMAFLPAGRRQGVVPATFVIDLHGDLLIADRRSEHVACVGDAEILAAGEMMIARTQTSVEVVEVTNQSTGFCPEPDCWEAVEAALDDLGVAHPGMLTSAFVFRRCEACGQINLIKDEEYECGVCSAPLSRVWNFAGPVS